MSHEKDNGTARFLRALDDADNLRKERQLWGDDYDQGGVCEESKAADKSDKQA